MSKLRKYIGPGFVTGAADNDLSGIVTYTQAGAQFGYKQLWFALFTLPFTIFIQEMCTRISVVTKRGITTVLAENYNSYLVYFIGFIFFTANIVNIGADLSAVAECCELLMGLNYYFWLLAIVLTVLTLQIFLSYSKYSNILLIFAFFVFCYIIVGLMTHQEWNQVLYSGLIPYFSDNLFNYLNL